MKNLLVAAIVLLLYSFCILGIRINDSLSAPRTPTFLTFNAIPVAPSTLLIALITLFFTPIAVHTAGPFTFSLDIISVLVGLGLQGYILVLAILPLLSTIFTGWSPSKEALSASLIMNIFITLPRLLGKRSNFKEVVSLLAEKAGLTLLSSGLWLLAFLNNILTLATLPLYILGILTNFLVLLGLRSTNLVTEIAVYLLAGGSLISIIPLLLLVGHLHSLTSTNSR
ncbi:MAG: hypothetical protein DRO12_04500 [Thermoprotei archaeon]|nr:MAG: hypothetical protein DRO12_04500 [Thermoprotei archaeon]